MKTRECNKKEPAELPDSRSTECSERAPLWTPSASAPPSAPLSPPDECVERRAPGGGDAPPRLDGDVEHQRGRDGGTRRRRAEPQAGDEHPADHAERDDRDLAEGRKIVSSTAIASSLEGAVSKSMLSATIASLLKGAVSESMPSAIIENLLEGVGSCRARRS